MAKTIKDGTGGLGVTLSASIGFSKSKSTSASTDQSVVASSVSGGDVTIIARGAGAPSSDGAGLGAITVIGSDVTAARDLTVLGAGPISFAAAADTDTTSGTSNARVAAVASVASGLAVANGVDAAKPLAGALNLGKTASVSGARCFSSYLQSIFQ